MSLSNIPINAPSPEQLHHVFFDPPEPPVLPAVRRSYHNGRRWKLETQGRADRRERRNYRDRMTWHYSNQYDAGKMIAAFDAAWVSHTVEPSLYEFLMKKI